MIELGGIGAGTLPPAWVDIYEEVQEKLKKMGSLRKNIQELYFHPGFRQGHPEIDCQ